MHRLTEGWCSRHTYKSDAPGVQPLVTTIALNASLIRSHSFSTDSTGIFNGYS